MKVRSVLKELKKVRIESTARNYLNLQGYIGSKIAELVLRSLPLFKEIINHPKRYRFVTL